jgi:uncharacterized protein (TIGR03066 family)
VIVRKPVAILAVVGLCLIPFAIAGCGKSKKDMIVGTWEAAEGGQVPPGTTVEFTKDGKMITKISVAGQEMSLTGKYEVVGDDLKTTNTNPKTKQEQSETDKITTLTDKELVLKDSKGKEVKFKKK